MKILLSSMILLLSIQFGFSQSQKMIDKANEKVEELNQLIVSQNPELALTADQKAQVQKLHIQKLKDIKKINKSEATEEEKKKQKKEVNRTVGKKIHQDVLTKEQRKAKTAAKNKRKE